MTDHEERVPNQPPMVDPGSTRLAIVGEAPAQEEVHWATCPQGHGFSTRYWQARQLVPRTACPLCGSQSFAASPTPFVGESGRLLNDLLREAGLPRERVWVGNVSRLPLREEEKTLEHCKGGLARLAQDLEEYRPTLVLALGGLALHALRGHEGDKISNWRGSLFRGCAELGSPKAMAAMHPAAVLREPSQLALLRFDIQRAVKEAATAELSTPKRVVGAPTPLPLLLHELSGLRGRTLGFDIEGTVTSGVTVLSFADSPEYALSVPLRRFDWRPVWSPEEEARLWAEGLRPLLEDPGTPKVCHNACYEGFVLRWLHGIELRGVEDTMLAWHVLFAELEKGLEVLASVLTRQPYWGTPDDWTDDLSRDTYNAIDSCVTLEAWRAMQPMFTPAQRSYYDHSRALLEPVLAMMLDGLAYDQDARDRLAAQLQLEVYSAQGELDALAGIPTPNLRDVAERVCMKNKLTQVQSWSDVLLYSKPSFRKPTGGY